MSRMEENGEKYHFQTESIDNEDDDDNSEQVMHAAYLTPPYTVRWFRIRQQKIEFDKSCG